MDQKETQKIIFALLLMVGIGFSYIPISYDAPSHIPIGEDGGFVFEINQSISTEVLDGLVVRVSVLQDNVPFRDYCKFETQDKCEPWRLDASGRVAGLFYIDFDYGQLQNYTLEVSAGGIIESSTFIVDPPFFKQSGVNWILWVTTNWSWIFAGFFVLSVLILSILWVKRII